MAFAFRRNTTALAPQIISPEMTVSSVEHEKPVESVSTISAELSILPDRIAVLRDEVRGMVQSDPAASVALLTGWLSESQQ